MGATSVTGVGVGSASAYGAGNKGSEHMSLGVHRLIGPRVTGASEIVLNASGFGLVVYPALPGGATLYSPFLSSNNAIFPYWGNFTATSFNVTGGPGAIVAWTVIKNGLWGALSNDGDPQVIANT
jgi:hypothetical protein